ncbi:MAG: BPSS1780 family membrane protein [Casimicrobiaceae bacterium]
MNAPPPAIDFVRYSGRRGGIWLKDAATMLVAQRIPWLVLIGVYYLIQLLVSALPVVGPLVLMVLRPVFTVGFLAAAWTQERGGKPEVRHLFRGFGSNLWALLPVGIVLIVGLTLAVLSTALVDGGVLLEAITSNAIRNEPFAPNSRVEVAMLVGIVLALFTILAIWFAPALIVFQDCGPWQAMQMSLRAALANWRPVAVYGLLLFFCGGVLPGLVIALIKLLVPAPAAIYVTLLTVFPYFCLFVAAQTISDYIAYRDIFHAGEASEAATVA